MKVFISLAHVCLRFPTTWHFLHHLFGISSPLLYILPTYIRDGWVPIVFEFYLLLWKNRTARFARFRFIVTCSCSRTPKNRKFVYRGIAGVTMIFSICGNDTITANAFFGKFEACVEHLGTQLSSLSILYLFYFISIRVCIFCWNVNKFVYRTIDESAASEPRKADANPTKWTEVLNIFFNNARSGVWIYFSCWHEIEWQWICTKYNISNRVSIVWPSQLEVISRY